MLEKFKSGKQNRECSQEGKRLVCTLQEGEKKATVVGEMQNEFLVIKKESGDPTLSDQLRKYMGNSSALKIKRKVSDSGEL